MVAQMQDLIAEAREQSRAYIQPLASLALHGPRSLLQQSEIFEIIDDEDELAVIPAKFVTPYGLAKRLTIAFIQMGAMLDLQGKMVMEISGPG